MRVAVSFSGGKDSAWALWRLLQSTPHEVMALFTTVTDEHVPLQNIPLQIIREQARRIGLPLVVVNLPEQCPDDEYAARMLQALAQMTRDYDLQAVAFGDLYLEDIRAYREGIVAATELRCEFPLWREDTAQLAREMLDSGLEATITAVDITTLPDVEPGTAYNHALLDRLPESVDPCGENGEFHTLCWNGPMFETPIHWSMGGARTEGPFAYLRY